MLTIYIASIVFFLFVVQKACIAACKQTSGPSGSGTSRRDTAKTRHPNATTAPAATALAREWHTRPRDQAKIAAIQCILAAGVVTDRRIRRARFCEYVMESRRKQCQKAAPRIYSSAADADGVEISLTFAVRRWRKPQTVCVATAAYTITVGRKHNSS